MTRRDITGAVDFGHLERFAAGDQQVVDEVLELFREQAAMWVQLLDPAAEGWRDAAHSLKGSALGVGAFTLADECDAAERAETLEERVLLAESIRDALAAALADIAAYAHEQALRPPRAPRA